MTTPETTAGLTIEDLADAGDEPVRALGAILQDYNSAFAGTSGSAPIRLFVRDASGTVLGGLVGYTSRSWCFVDMLALSEPLRGQGFGTRLLERAEAIARERGCVGIYLSTFSFQAPEFYRHHGYAEFARIEDFPPGFASIWLMKRF